MFLKEIQADAYELEVFIETSEIIGGAWMREKLKEITAALLPLIRQPDKYAAYRLERPMRAMVKIGKPEDEEWVLCILDQLEFDEGTEFAQLRRAMEYLANHESLKALPIILEIGNRHFADGELGGYLPACL